MGNSFPLSGGGVDAVEGVFGSGRAPAVCRSAAGRRSDERGLSRVRHKTARSTGPENLSKPVIAAAIAKGRLKQAERAELTGDMVISELRLLAFANLGHYFDAQLAGNPKLLTLEQ